MQEYQDQCRAMVSSSRGRGIPPATAGAVIALVLALLSPVAEPGESTEIVWHAALEVAAGEAHRGAWRMNESDFRYVDDASVALHEDGMAAVVWADQAQQEVFLQRYDRDGEPQLDAPTNISRSADTFSRENA